MTKPQGYKTFLVLKSAEHEITSADKYENANLCWHFHIFQQRKFDTQLNSTRKQLYISVLCYLLAGKISCSAELSMKKVL